VSDTLSNNSDKNIKELDKGVNKMFNHFPPRAGRISPRFEPGYARTLSNSGALSIYVNATQAKGEIT
jgi:hypothetical protein